MRVEKKFQPLNKKKVEKKRLKSKKTKYFFCDKGRELGAITRSQSDTQQVVGLLKLR